MASAPASAPAPPASAMEEAFDRAVAAADGAPPPRPPSPLGSNYVVNRRGERVPVCFDEITRRNRELATSPAYGPSLGDEVGGPDVTAAVIAKFVPGMTTRELDFLATQALGNDSLRPGSQRLAARICVSDLHKRLPADPREMAALILREAPSREAARLSPAFLEVLALVGEEAARRLRPRRDFLFGLFGLQTLAQSYLLRPRGRARAESTLLEAAVHERPGHLYLRIALGVFLGADSGADPEAPLFRARLADAFRLYDALSCHLVSNATPTAINAGTAHPQMSSCFQMATADSILGLFQTVGHAASISKWSGGTSVWLHGVRAEGALIHSTGGRSRGVVPFLQVLEKTQLYADQGGNRRGAGAVYLSADHADLEAFLAAPRVKGAAALLGLTAPELHYALWVPDLFMEALEADLRGEAAEWHLFCPREAPGLHLVYGAEYRALYMRYVAEGRFRRAVAPSLVMAWALESWAQVGNPYVLFKDAFNRKSNMQNVAPICSSNLCCEIGIPSWSEEDASEFAAFHPDNAAGGEYGVCNLAAVCLGSFVEGEGAAGRLDFQGVAAAAALETRALNRVIDGSFYPTPECERGNRRHRPIGIGMMGLADVLARLGLPYGSPGAVALARGAAAALYYGALSESCRLAAAEGPYASFAGSPASAGRLAPDLWEACGDLAPGWEAEVAAATGGWLGPEAWGALRRAVAATGLRNAYVTAYMPTATTSQIVGQNESFEPFTSNIYVRKTQAGEFLVVNRHLVAALEARGLWSDALRRQVIAAGGSVQAIPGVPEDLRRLFRTARELHPTLTIRMAAAMAPFVCQSLSMNLFLDRPDLPKINRFLLEGWHAGLKTGLYYCHTLPAAGAPQSSVRAAPAAADPPGGGAPPPGGAEAPEKGPEAAAEDASLLEGMVCTRGGDCTSCGV